MKAEILSIGTELLLGEILNTNAQFISTELANLGIDVFYQTVVGDNEERILNAYKTAFERADIVITTGGLGPTDDDLSKEMAAKFFKKELVLDETSLENIKIYFKNKDSKLPKTNVKQAYLPKGCTILKNNNGTAPGIIIKENDKTLIMLPGPPNEVEPMFKESVIPFLAKIQTKVLVSKNLNLVGIGESEASEKIKDLMLNAKNPTIAPYTKNNGVRFRITANAKSAEDAKKLLSPTVKQLYSVFGDFIYSEDDEDLEEVVAKKLIEKNMTISVAESCSGGLVSSTLVNFSGVSKVFLGSIVTYSNESKVKELGVCKDTLAEKGSVSEEVALQMAENVLLKFGSSVGLSVTGVAGPDSSEKKPVGLVYIAVAIKGKKTIVKKLNLTGNRQKIRDKTVVEILNELRLNI